MGYCKDFKGQTQGSGLCLRGEGTSPLTPVEHHYLCCNITEAWQMPLSALSPSRNTQQVSSSHLSPKKSAQKLVTQDIRYSCVASSLSCSAELKGSFSEGCNSARERVIGSSLWDGSYNEKVGGKGRQEASPSSQYLCVNGNSTLFLKADPQAHLPEQMERVFQRPSSLLKLNSIPNPHFKLGIILPPAPLSAHLQADGAQHPLPALSASTEEEGRKKTARQRQLCL